MVMIVVCVLCVCVNVSLAPSTGACLVLMTNSLLALSTDLRDPTTVQPSKPHVRQALLAFFPKLEDFNCYRL